MRLIIIYFVTLNFVSSSLAQSQSTRQISIGDLVPDYEISNIINYTKPSINLSEFRDKLLILDFWATWCNPCIAAFPKLDSLNKKFKDEIEILSVTNEKKDLVDNFLKKMNSVKHILPSTATEDSTLGKMFKHIFLPHYVWINKGTLIGMTGREDVNETNVSLILNGKLARLNTKNDFERRINYPAGQDIPTFAPSMEVMNRDKIELVKIPDTSLVFYSSFTKYLEGLLRGYHEYFPNLFTARNCQISELYKVALLKNSVGALNRYPGGVIIEIKDTILYDKITSERMNLRGLQFEDWMRNNGYCYDIKVPQQLIDTKFVIMLEELNRYFGILLGIEGVIEQRKAKYLALVKIGKLDNLKSKGGEPIVEVDKFSINIRNKKISSLITTLIKPLQKYPPVSNETKYDEPIDLKITCDLSNITELNKELRKLGLQLVEKEKIFATPVIRLVK